MANYKQYYIRDFKVGDTAWVWLDSSPWHFHKGASRYRPRLQPKPGRRQAAALRGADHGLIRLQRRIPVTIVLGTCRRLQALHGCRRAHRHLPVRGVSEIGRYGKAVVEDVREGARLLDRTLTGFGRELADIGTRPARGAWGPSPRFSVVLTTIVALMMQLDAPWWAAISGYMSLMSTGAPRCDAGLLRLSGTIAGAALGFVMARWLPYDQVALCLFLGCATLIGVIAVQVSPHGLAGCSWRSPPASCC